MVLSKEIKELRKEHNKVNQWLESRGRSRDKTPMPWNLLTEAEKLRRERQEAKKKQNLEDKRQFDLQIKEVYGLKLPYEFMSHFIRGAGDDKRVRVIEKRALMNYSRIDGNTCDFRGRRLKQKFMAFDIDSNLSSAEFHDATGVLPTFLVGKKLPDGRLERPHAIIELRYPVSLERKHSTELDLFHEVYDEIYERLHAAGHWVDRGQKTTFKNPDFSGWDVETAGQGGVRLQDLKKELERTAARVWKFAEAVRAIAGLPEQTNQVEIKMPERPVNVGGYSGRNETLFHEVRFKIMDNWKDYKGQDIAKVSYDLLKEMDRDEGFQLPECELRSIAKSHGKFFKKFKGKRNLLRKQRNDGAARHLILRHMTKQQRQAIGAYYTHSVCGARTLRLIQNFKKTHPGVSISRAAKDLGIDRKTARRYFHVKSESDLAVMRKIKELREHVVSYWASKNQQSITPVQIHPGESGLFREMIEDKKETAMEPKAENTENSISESVRVPSRMVLKLREIRLRDAASILQDEPEPPDFEATERKDLKIKRYVLGIEIPDFLL